MTTMNLLLSEMRFRWLNSVLTLLAIAAAATLFVGGPMLIAVRVWFSLPAMWKRRRLRLCCELLLIVPCLQDMPFATKPCR